MNECHEYITKNNCAVSVLWDSHGWMQAPSTIKLIIDIMNIIYIYIPFF